ncbi:c-type cytochrome [Cyclobacterium marinum]|uniref:c-type cytochrome n=1 Tax=Cyclobacterium marinum TaxID=104 RepID=UPI0030D9B2EE|tara:strand:- start:83275 stop:85029 length:1755 start_codon:yes stop_codon:yes gene_type:complete
MNANLQLLFLCFLLSIVSCKDQKENKVESEVSWIIPDSIKLAHQPEVSINSIDKGKNLFQIYCSTCHGNEGRGDGAAGQAMGAQPADLTSEKVLAQSGGEIFYKIAEGKGVMPSFRDLLTEEERWALVGFIQHLKEMEPSTSKTIQPKPIVSDLVIEHFTKVVPRVVRIWEGSDQFLWYATIGGDVYRLPMNDPHQLEKMLELSDHGISRLQGATMHAGQLFLSGNVRVNDNKGTMGRMVRVNWDNSANAQVTVMFTTAEYGTTNTPFDHGWSALQVSKDGKSIFVVSGSRTDHGEVQDNLGAYPNSRDVALTSKIFRIPIDAENLLLPDDLSFLKKNGYLYAEGLRNAYDLALDPKGRLLAVVNSGDYDQNEDMFWVREGFHYGYPWVMGGMESPQQFPDWFPDPSKDPFLNEGAAAWPDDFYNDPEFPEKPKGVEFGKSIVNYGPDADKFRDEITGEIQDASNLGVGITTFTPHSSPLGLVSDNANLLPGRFKGKAMVLRYTSGKKSVLMQPFTSEGEDLLLLDLEFSNAEENFNLNAFSIATGFSQPVDAVLVDENLYVIEYGGKELGGNIWKITFKDSRE